MDRITLILIGLSAVFAVGVAYFQYLFKIKDKSQYLYWLSFFRAIALFCLLVLVINPSLNRISYENIKPRLHVVVDNSKSIAHKQNESKVAAILQNFQNSKTLSDKFDVGYFSFGSGVDRLDSMNFTDNYTNIDRVFTTFSEGKTSLKEATVLITDGNVTAGRTLNRSSANHPVFPIIVGDTAVYEDLSIDRLNVNPTTFLNNNAPVEVFVNYTGQQEVNKELSLYKDAEKISSKQITFTKTQNAAAVSFFIPAKEEGRHYYSARIEPLQNERNTNNNVRSFALNVIKEQSKILLVSNIVHPDLGMLQTSIRAKKEREVDLTSTDAKIDINEYDLIILYQPDSKFQELMEEIDSKEMNYLLISGMATDWDFLNEVQTNFKRQTIAAEEDFTAEYNPEYSTFLTEPVDVDKWPPLQHDFGKLVINTRFNTLLFQTVNGIKTNESVLGTFEAGNQKVGLFFGENFWKWRMFSYKKTQSFDTFDTFFSNLIQYLSSKKQKNRLNVSLKELYYANELVEFTASYLDDNLNFDPKAILEVSIVNEEKTFQRMVPFTAYTNTFKAAFSNLPEGAYNYTVRVQNENISKFGTFKVASYNLEEQFSASQWRALGSIANETGGELYFEQESETAISQLLANSTYNIVQKKVVEKTPLIEWQFLMLIIILALGLEWFARKYFGKL